ncbi:MAG: hypothetical protein L3J18_00795 [Candidatus Brocadia sp.]|jgi:hypothetical protein|uniref:Sugar 3,4-ketoisomerase QdtA cupin domain-containing protein n=1 Tax=Candidatus Brocadia fulgida TaxID=380242 RepID=A0A0M2UTG9_9BACT|nr:MAG: hypothetical protein BROFUL_02389 [Candidatus Brocadia fulgida]UJS20895.1 MAG: hypothetical protein L3J18_00795 [Candidatus Brocadia sp.]
MIKEITEEGLEYLYHEGELYSVVLRNSFTSNTIRFFTPDSFSQQLGYLPHKKGNIIKPHKHKINKREILYTHEVILLKKGKVKVNFYKNEKTYVDSEMLNEGDIILLCGGGHGFELLEDTIMIEIKQGPYVGLDDKERFEGVEECK